MIREARDADTLEEYVVYKGLYDDSEYGHNPLWVRKKKEFLEKVEIEGKKVERYRFVGKI